MTENSLISDLVEVFSCGPHLLPGFIKQLDADTEELFPCTVMGKEHGVVVIAALIGYTKENNGKMDWKSFSTTTTQFPKTSLTFSRFTNIWI